MTRRRSWTDDDLRAAAASCGSMAEVAGKLGLWAGGSTNRTLKDHAARLGITLPVGWHRPRHTVKVTRSWDVSCSSCGPIDSRLPLAQAERVARAHRDSPVPASPPGGEGR